MLGSIIQLDTEFDIRPDTEKKKCRISGPSLVPTLLSVKPWEKSSKELWKYYSFGGLVSLSLSLLQTQEIIYLLNVFFQQRCCFN